MPVGQGTGLRSGVPRMPPVLACEYVCVCVCVCSCSRERVQLTRELDAALKSLRKRAEAIRAAVRACDETPHLKPIPQEYFDDLVSVRRHTHTHTLTEMHVQMLPIPQEYFTVLVSLRPHTHTNTQTHTHAHTHRCIIAMKQAQSSGHLLLSW